MSSVCRWKYVDPTCPSRQQQPLKVYIQYIRHKSPHNSMNSRTLWMAIISLFTVSLMACRMQRCSLLPKLLREEEEQEVGVNLESQAERRIIRQQSGNERNMQTPGISVCMVSAIWLKSDRIILALIGGASGGGKDATCIHAFFVSCGARNSHRAPTARCSVQCLTQIRRQEKKKRSVMSHLRKASVN